MLSRKSASAVAMLIVTACGLSGCGDGKAPGKEVFSAALGPIVRDRFCNAIDVAVFAVEGQAGDAVFPLITSPKRTMFGAGSDGRSVAMLDALAGEGYVTRTTFEKPARRKGSDEAFVRQPLISYAPTEKSASYLRAIDRKATDRMVSVPSICIAKGEVVDVLRWSEPVDFGGRRVSQVTYTYHGVDPIPAMPKSEQAAMAEPKETTAPFELQSDGWRPVVR